MFKSRIHMPCISVCNLINLAKRNWNDRRILTVFGKVGDNPKLLRLPKHVRVCALRFSNSARQRIESRQGHCYTFDQLALLQPKGSDTLLLRGKKNNRKARKYWGAAGIPGSGIKPYTRSKGRKFEKVRARRIKKKYWCWK